MFLFVLSLFVSSAMFLFYITGSVSSVFNFLYEIKEITVFKSGSCGSRGFPVLVVGYPVALAARSPAIGKGCNFSRSIRSVRDLEKRLSSVSFPFYEVVPQSVMEWFDIFVRSHSTSRELLLVSALASTSALIGKTTLEAFPSYEEKGNLFFIAVAQSFCFHKS